MMAGVKGRARMTSHNFHNMAPMSNTEVWGKFYFTLKDLLVKLSDGK